MVRSIWLVPGLPLTGMLLNMLLGIARLRRRTDMQPDQRADDTQHSH